VAIANAKIAYLKFQEIFANPKFQALKRKERKSSASSGPVRERRTTLPATYYIDNLIGPDTVNTMPAATFNAFRDHGKVYAAC